MERSVILLDNEHIDLLATRARSAGVTISWILRCLYFQHRDFAINARPRRPDRSLPTHSSPFAMCWHGDRSAVQYFLYIRGLELSAIMRFLVGLYLAGGLSVDLANERLAKREYDVSETTTVSKPLFVRFRYMHQYSTALFKKEHYWPIDHSKLLSLLESGLANRKWPRKYGPK